MAAIASDTFNSLALDQLLEGRTLDNGLGGSGSRMWVVYDGSTNNLRGNGSGGLVAPGNQAFGLCSISGAVKARFKFDPSSGKSNIGLLVGALNNIFQSSGVLVRVSYAHTYLTIEEMVSGAPVERNGLVITAPSGVFYLEAEVSGSTLTARILNSDTSVRNTTSYTFGSSPIDGNFWGFGFAQDGATGVFDDFIADDGVAGDTTAPTLTSATATATSATTATGGVTTDEAGPAWAVLTTSNTTPSAAQIKAGQNHLGAAASASATATLSVGANSGVFSFTGLTAGQTYWPHVVQDDTATPANTSTPITSASSITTPTPDTTPPTMNGSITVGTKTSGSISISYPAASDNVAVTGYEVSTNGTTWSDNGTSLSYTFLGLSALTSYTLYVRAYDAAGNRAATPLTVTTSTYRAGDTAANILANTGPVGGNPAGFLYAFAATVNPTDWLSYREVSGPTPSGGTLTANPDGTFTYFGPDAAVYVIQPEVNMVDAAETITVTLYDQSPDTELPVLTGSITVTNLTSTSYDLSWPTGTDNTGVTGYEYSLNGGASWADNGNVTTKAITGRTPESTDEVRVRAYDAAGNKSTPALATSVTLLAGPDVTAPTLSDPTAYASGPTTASGTVTTNEATGTLYYLRNNSATATDVAVKAGLSQAVIASGIQTVNVTGLTASTPGNYIHYLHRDAAGNDSLVSSSAAFTTPAPPAPGMKVIGAQPTKLIARPITRPIAIRQTD